MYRYGNNWKKLYHFSIYHNQLHGTLPTSYANWISLERVDFSGMSMILRTQRFSNLFFSKLQHLATKIKKNKQTKKTTAKK